MSPGSKEGFMKRSVVVSMIAGLAMSTACSNSGTSNAPTGSGGVSASGGSAAGGSGAGGSGGATQPATKATGGQLASGGSSGGMGGAGAGGAATGGTGPRATGGSGAGGAGGSSQPRDAGTAGAGSGGSVIDAGGGGTGSGGVVASGGTGNGGSTGSGGSTGTPGPAALVACPDLPGAVASPLYSVTVGGKPLFVEKLTKFSPDMQVHYAHGSLAGTGTVTVAVTVKESFNNFTLSPKSRKLAATKSGSTITFDTGPNYLILQVDSKELLFILLDAEEVNPPQLGDANVKNIADYSVDNTGATLVTSKIQSAINEASGATQNILYFPPGRYKVGELWLKSNMTMYLA